MSQTRVTAIGSVSEYRWHGRSSNRLQVQYSATVLYQFYIDSANGFGNALAWRKSADAGETWSSGTLVFTDSVLDLDVYYERWNATANSPIVHIASHSDGTTIRGLQYAQLNLSTDTLTKSQTLVDWAIAEYNGGPLAVGVARNGNIHVTAYGSIFGPARHFISTNGGTSFSASADQDFGQSIRDVVQLWPDHSSGDTADMLAIWIDWDAATLYATQWDQSAGVWLTNTEISTGITPSSEGPISIDSYQNLGVAYRRSDEQVPV